MRTTSTSWTEVADNLSRIVRAGRRRAGHSPEAGLGLLAALVADGPRRPRDLLAGSGLEQSTVSRHLARLSREGYIARSRDLADKRAVVLTATPAGRALLATYRQRRTADVQAALRGWSQDDLTTLTGLLSRLAGDLEALPTPAAPELPAASAARC